MPVKACLLCLAIVLATISAGAGAQARTPKWMQLSAPRPVEEARRRYLEFQAPFAGSQTDATLAHKFDAGLVAVFSMGHPADEQWWFFAAPGQLVPDSAYRLIEPTSPPYRVIVEQYCDGAACERLLARVQSISAPEVGLGRDERLKPEWRAIVAEEPCDSLRPARMRQPTRPEARIRPGTELQVELKAFHNRCGDVREVIVSKSSGDETVDNHAQMVVSGWRVIPRPANSSGWSTETIRFPAAASPPVSDAVHAGER